MTSKVFILSPAKARDPDSAKGTLDPLPPNPAYLWWAFSRSLTTGDLTSGSNTNRDLTDKDETTDVNTTSPTQTQQESQDADA